MIVTLKKIEARYDDTFPPAKPRPLGQRVTASLRWLLSLAATFLLSARVG